MRAAQHTTAQTSDIQGQHEAGQETTDLTAKVKDLKELVPEQTSPISNARQQSTDLTSEGQHHGAPVPKVRVKNGLQASTAALARRPHICLQPALHNAVAIQHQLDALQGRSRRSSTLLAESMSCLAAHGAEHWLSLMLSPYPSTS